MKVSRSSMRKSKNRMSLISEHEKQITEQVNQADSQKDKEFQKQVDINNKKSAFRKVFKYNSPVIFVYIGVFSSIVLGACMPVFGIFFSKYLQVTTENIPPGPYNPTMTEDHYDNIITTKTNEYIGYVAAIGGTVWFMGYLNKYMFGVVGENVTIKIRKVLYASIMRKNIGWFDDRENAPGILTSSMAQDTAVLNGVSTESLASIAESIFALVTGISIGFYYCWQLALVCLGCVPLMALGSFFQARFSKQAQEESDDNAQEANMLAGDAILNYRTVASFAQEEKIIKKYEELLEKQIS